MSIRVGAILAIIAAVAGCRGSDCSERERPFIELDASVHIRGVSHPVTDQVTLCLSERSDLDIVFVNSTDRPLQFIGWDGRIYLLECDLFKDGESIPRDITSDTGFRVPDDIITVPPGGRFVHVGALTYYVKSALKPGQYRLRISLESYGDYNMETKRFVTPIPGGLEKWVDVTLVP